MNIKEQVVAILADVAWVEVGFIKISAGLRDLGISRLDCVTLRHKIDTQFGIDFQVIHLHWSVDDLIRHVYVTLGVPMTIGENNAV